MVLRTPWCNGREPQEVPFAEMVLKPFMKNDSTRQVAEEVAKFSSLCSAKEELREKLVPELIKNPLSSRVPTVPSPGRYNIMFALKSTPRTQILLLLFIFLTHFSG